MSSDDGMDPFIGYALLRKASGDYTLWMQGTLNASSNQTINGTKLIYNGSSNTENLLANSWMAPIHIDAFVNSDFTNVERTIYIFNAGTPDQYESAGDGSASASDPGTYIVLPIESAPWVSPTITVIPAMQAFSVYATGASPSLTLNYERLVYTPALTSVGVVPTRAPRRARTAAAWSCCYSKLQPEHCSQPLFDRCCCQSWWAMSCAWRSRELSHQDCC